MLFYYFNVGLTYVAIGLACAVFYVFILRKTVLGRFWGALIVGLVGSFLGGILRKLDSFDQFDRLQRKFH